MICISAREEIWSTAGRFTISRGSRGAVQVVVVEIRDGDKRGWAECVPYGRYGEDTGSVLAQINQVGDAVAAGASREAVQQMLPAGAARNAVDCAFWDLQAKRQQTSVWEMIGLPCPEYLVTAYTLSLAEPDEMGAKAAVERTRPLLKIKLGGDGDEARVRAVRAGAPEARLIVDANEAWREADVAGKLEAMARLGVAMVEQPLPAGKDDILARLTRPLPVCADESCHTTEDLTALKPRYDMINIKLDKTGGLTEALRLLARARELELGVMVGCMLGTSLAMAPAYVLGADASFVDLDGPLLLRDDREPAIEYTGSRMFKPTAALWGGAV